MLDSFFNFAKPAGGVITTTSVTITFNKAPTDTSTAPFNYMMETNLANPNGSNGTTFYAALQGYGFKADGTQAAGQGLFSLWNANPANALAGSGSVAAPFANEGTGASIRHPLNITTGSTFVLTTTLSNNILTETMTDKGTGTVYLIGAFTNVNATSLVNSMALVVEDFGDTTAAQIAASQNANVTYSNFTVNGASAPMNFNGTANPSSSPFQYCQEAGTNFYQCAAGGNSGLNEVQLGVAKATIQGAGANAAIQATAAFHSLIGDMVTGVAILDIAGQVVTMTASQKAEFSKVTDSVGGGVVEVMNGSAVAAVYKLVNGTLTQATGPTIAHQTIAQTAKPGGAVSVDLSVVFTDQSPVTLKVTGAPFWLTFNASTDLLTGTDPTGAAAKGVNTITATATDGFGMTKAETFTLTSYVNPVAKAVTGPTWKDGHASSFILPASTFSDPGQALTLTATQQNGSALPSWLHFNAVTDTFTGTPPASATTTTLAVDIHAVDLVGLSADAKFSITFQHA